MWATPDSGKSWLLVGQTRDGKNSVQAEFPREGLFGYSFVVKSATSGPAARGGDARRLDRSGYHQAGCRVLAANSGAGTIRQPGRRVVARTATRPEPTSAPQPTGPWQPLAEKLANTGKYRWTLPKPGWPGLRAAARNRPGRQRERVRLCDTGQLKRCAQGESAERHRGGG